MSTVYIEKTDTGATLCCWLYCTHWMLYTAQQMGYTGYVHWPDQPGRSLQPHQDPVAFARQPNMFEWWFEQPFYKDAEPAPRDLTWIWENCPETGLHCLSGQGLAFIKEWYQKHLIIKPEIVARADALAAKYSLDFDNTIAVTWRGCESAFDPWREHAKETIECYFPHIDAILEKEPNLRIFATAEETTVADKVMARYPDRTFFINEFFTAPLGYKGQSGWINPTSGYERGVQTCVFLSILSRCKHYVKNKSNQSYIAGWLSKGNVVHVNHPETN